MMDITAIRALIDDDMQALNRLILNRLHSEVVLVKQIGNYIINSGGKRLRPMLHLLCAKALGYSGGQEHILIAGVIEFIHTSTLLHDDVVDGSDMRRGQQTANNIWGNEASVLVGDFLYSRSFQMMVEINSLAVMKLLADTTNTIAEGEVLQLLNCNEPDITQAAYLQVIRSKTAKLFEAAAQLASIITAQPEYTTNMATFGMHLGTAFQIVDDALDYGASGVDIGKNIGDDLAEGKATLPLIYALRLSSETQQQILREAIINGGKQYIQPVIAAIKATNAIELTMQDAQQEVDLAIAAIEPLPNSDYKQALQALAYFAVQRSY
jgi:octaprenyl-diphosphate synthase